MADILISQLPRTSVAGSDDLLIIDNIANNGAIVTRAIALKNLVRDVQFEDGSAVAPSITFVKDTNTGFYRVGNDTIGFTTAGLNRMVINDAGHVGINTLTPSELFTVVNGKIAVQTGGGNELLLETRDGGAGLTQTGSLPLVFATNNTLRLKITEDGKVLVNTETNVAGVQMNVFGGSFVCNGASFVGTPTGDVILGYTTTANKQLFKLNYAGAIGNSTDEFGLPGQVLTSQGDGAPFAWTTPTGGGGGGTASEPYTNPGPSAPDPKVYGQFWFNSNEETLYIWNGTSWQQVGDGGSSSIDNGAILPPNADEGDLFWNTATKKLYAYDNDAGEWVIVGPQDPNDIDLGGGISFPTTFLAAASLPDSNGINTQADLNQWLVNSVAYLEDEKVEESPGDAKVYGRKTDGGTSEWVEVATEGPAGQDGISATVDVGTVNTGDAGTPVVITNSGPDSHNAIFDFTIPKGDKGEDGAPGTGIQLQGSFDYVGPPTADPEATNPNDGDLWIDVNGDGWAYDGADWNNVGPIQGPKGDDGEAATITIGETTTGAAGTEASVVNDGTLNDAILKFTIPRGDKGEDGDPGPDGTAATVDVDPNTVTGLPGTLASVTNEGTTSAAIFKFTIPRGAVGEDGPPGEPQKVHVGNTPPPGADEGDLWYETDTDTLKIKIGTDWIPVAGDGGGGVLPSPIEPDPAEIGDLWYNTNNDKIYYYDGNDWVELAVQGEYVDLTTNQTIGGIKTFTEKIVGSIDLAIDCSRSINVGDGLNGGGELNQDVAVALDIGNGLEFVGTSPNTLVSVAAGDDTITVDAQGVKANIGNIFDPANLNAVISFNGRKGTVVPAEGDYSLNQLADVDTTTSGEGYVLTQVGTQWLPREVSVGGQLSLQGTIDATSQTAPTADHGDYYINTQTGTVLNHVSWGSLATSAISDGDMVAKLEAPNEWAIIGNSGGSGGGVNSVTATNGAVNTGSSTAVVIEVDDTVVRTTGNQTISGTKTFDQPIVGDITGEAVDCSRSVLAGVALTGGGKLNANVTLDVNYAEPLTVTSDQLTIALGPGLVVDGGNLTIDDNYSFPAGDGKIEFEEGAGGGISMSGDLLSTANQTSDTKLTFQCDATVVRTHTDQTIGGVKTFSAQTLLDGGFIAGTNSSVDGTFGVSGLSTLTGGFSAGADSSVTGTFGVSGLSTLTGGFSAGADSSVVGKITTTSTVDTDPGTTLVTKDYLEGSNGLAGHGLQQVLTVGNISDKSIELTDGNDLIHIDPQLNKIIVGGSDDSSTPTIELANYDGDASHDNKFYISLVDGSTSVDFGSSTGVTTYDFHFYHQDDPVIQFNSSGKITANTFDIDSLDLLP